MELGMNAFEAPIAKCSKNNEDEKVAMCSSMPCCSKRDPFASKDQRLNVLLAESGTTTCCLTWTFQLLARETFSGPLSASNWD
ncbi:hypothetical protein F4677DRAFT_429364 [Hypoxylon crocopeplum]|nr:hypothetical protein F4677DRAFT_429364 [Hypoxylon crocopeplum]